MTPDDDERPKKSWREIDQQRDGSSQRRSDPKPEQSKRERTSEYRSYKAQLNRLFEGGAMPDALKERLDDGMMAEKKKRQEGIDAIKTATTPKAMLAALGLYEDAHGFPEDEMVLAKLLDLTDEQVVLKAVRTIDRLLGEERLKKSSSFKARLQTVQMIIDDPDVQDEAKALLRKL
ncbi:MAG: hypothetical protein A2341_22895 [Deltaproteobacteria bacterium RIFOXYB12_FULL_58_9]|nr:MAG: hypothetical protein A2341_22895 [Deltaproteobacteria bacterium RIFOXYB12_FULL_58_9]